MRQAYNYLASSLFGGLAGGAALAGYWKPHAASCAIALALVALWFEYRSRA